MTYPNGHEGGPTDRLHTIRAAVCGFAGAAGSFLASAFGGWGSDLTTLVLFMNGDIAHGVY